jgi:hypothetical protein
MKKFLLFILTWLVMGASGAQDRFFLYFESGDHSPFYIKMGDKVYSSVAPGYLILPGFTSGTYNMIIGTLAEQKKESRFSIRVNDRDLGLVIIKASEKIRLQEVNSSSSLEPLEDPMRKAVSYQVRTDPFSILLSKASGDPGLLMVPVFASEPAKSETVVAAAKPAVVQPEISAPVISSQPSRDSDLIVERSKPAVNSEKIVIADTMAAIAEQRENVAVKDPIKESALPVADPLKSNRAERGEEELGTVIIRRYAENSSADGFHLVYLEETSIKTDTIRIHIPNPRYNLIEVDTTTNPGGVFLVVEKPARNQSTTVTEKKGETKEAAVTKTAEVTESRVNAETERIAAPVLPANRCRNLASENDFFKIRRNMATRYSDEQMVEEAKKIFRSRCFTTEQIRLLSSLFLTSAGKYLFFDASYIYVSDPVNFGSLQAEIKDEYYLRRFKALIGQ